MSLKSRLRAIENEAGAKLGLEVGALWQDAAGTWFVHYRGQRRGFADEQSARAFLEARGVRVLIRLGRSLWSPGGEVGEQAG